MAQRTASRQARAPSLHLHLDKTLTDHQDRRGNAVATKSHAVPGRGGVVLEVARPRARRNGDSVLYPSTCLAMLQYPHRCCLPSHTLAIVREAEAAMCDWTTRDQLPNAAFETNSSSEVFARTTSSIRAASAQSCPVDKVERVSQVFTQLAKL